MSSINQEPGNYNAWCNSCDQITALNVDSKTEAFELNEEHSKGSACDTFSVEMIKPQEDQGGHGVI